MVLVALPLFYHVLVVLKFLAGQLDKGMFTLEKRKKIKMNWAILGIKLLKAFNATSIVMNTIFVLMKILYKNSLSCFSMIGSIRKMN